MNYELTSEEVTLIISRARQAKMNGFAGVTCKFSDYKIASIRVEIDTPRETINNIYKNRLTVVCGTSSIQA